MGRIKEFYHEELLALQEGEELTEEMMAAKWKKINDEATEKNLLEMEKESKEIDESGVQRFLHPNF